jgi:hypothetical protein
MMAELLQIHKFPIQLKFIGWSSTKEHTFAMDPQRGSSNLPFLGDSASKEPLRCSLVLTMARDVVVCRRVGEGLSFF